jgi:hypothetical protein
VKLLRRVFADAAETQLALALTARSLLDLGLVLAACARAGGLGGCCFACCALNFLALFGIGDALGICHWVTFLE